ncbi:helix-turn-helix domain-containing protein [Streptomyces sp. NBC_00503]|uniref:helix-turn-helix domain-containing protein n=1 Tax=Streptomyces sp. NBC_00503 TaxID=2903659 RepID=UPI002E8145FB|nr:FeoC-like transcriptional regulator [Streptomyces sp. NBC_00503]WUD79892.1 FeoC-like transcriptional regulator [Streptomyces sp. NBC_00503]
MLRRLLRAFEEAAPGEGLAQVADRLGIGRSEAADLAAYWVRKGRLRREEIGAPDCSGCSFASRSCTTCPTASASPRPVLIALSPVRSADPARSEGPGSTGRVSPTRPVRPVRRAD